MNIINATYFVHDYHVALSVPDPGLNYTELTIAYYITETYLLCLLGDLDKHILSEISLTVSLYDTTGSLFLRGIQAWSSSRSLRQISRWSSPAPF